MRFPMGPVLRKELGEQLVAAGLVGVATTLLKRPVALCYPHTALQHFLHPPNCSVACRHAFSVRFPMGPVLRKELGEQLVAAGLVGVATTLLKRPVALCYPHTALQHFLHPPNCSVACRHAFSVRFPMGPVLRKELGEQLVAAGLVGAAMTLFEELELWDALILCYRLLQKNVQAEELVLRRLEVST